MIGRKRAVKKIIRARYLCDLTFSIVASSRRNVSGQENGLGGDLVSARARKISIRACHMYVY